MKYNKYYNKYIYEYKGVKTLWEEDDEEAVEATAKMLSENYLKHLDEIAEFMLPDLCTAYEVTTLEEVKDMIGTPSIDYSLKTVEYWEPKVDDFCTLEFSFMDDATRNYCSSSLHHRRQKGRVS